MRTRRTLRSSRAGVVLGLVVLGLVTTTGTASAGSTIYSTDFSDPAATSVEWEFKDGATTETGKGYTLETTPGAFTVGLDGAANLWVSPAAGSLPADQVIETTIAAATGDSSVQAGVICRASLDDDLGYAFLVASDGNYTIGAYAGAGPKRLVNAKGTKRADAIDPAGPNTVRGVCKSAGKNKVRLTLFVNDEKVASVVDRTSPSKIGPDAYLLTEVTKGRPADVTFSSFAISAA